MNGYSNHYRKNQVMTATPEQILIMLYDGSIQFCRQAIHAMDAGQRTVQAEKISRAMTIICEFSNTLDHEVGGDIAAELDALYGFMVRELTKANVQNDRKALVTVEDLLIGLRSTWAEAIEINRGGIKKSEAAVSQVAVSF